MTESYIKKNDLREHNLRLQQKFSYYQTTYNEFCSPSNSAFNTLASRLNFFTSSAILMTKKSKDPSFQKTEVKGHSISIDELSFESILFHLPFVTRVNLVQLQ